jgi:hypothetical protein
MPLGNGVNSRTIARDLAILTETHLYNIEIKVCGGSRRIAKEALAAQQALQMQKKPILGMIAFLAGVRSLRWRMPPRQNPKRSRHHQIVIIQLQRNDHNPPNRRQSHHHSSAIRPSKMLTPNVNAWIKQRHPLPRLHIIAINLRTFNQIATITSSR